MAFVLCLKPNKKNFSFYYSIIANISSINTLRISITDHLFRLGAYFSVSAIESSISLAVAFGKFFRHATKIHQTISSNNDTAVGACRKCYLLKPYSFYRKVSTSVSYLGLNFETRVSGLRRVKTRGTRVFTGFGNKGKFE